MAQPEKVLAALQQRTLLTKRQSPGSGGQIRLRTDGAGVAGRPRFVSDTENTRFFYTLTYRCPAYRPCLSEKDTDIRTMTSPLLVGSSAYPQREASPSP